MTFIPTLADATPGDIIRAKWLLDGCATLADAAAHARLAAEQLQALHDAGWTLTAPITDDYGQLVDPTGNTGTPAGEEEDGDGEGEQYPYESSAN